MRANKTNDSNLSQNTRRSGFQELVGVPRHYLVGNHHLNKIKNVT
jgi:hypothetical protein